MSRTDPQLKVRLPLEMKEELEQAAKENHRSMNAEIVARLQESLHQRFVPSEAADMSPEDRLKALRAEMDRTMAEYHNAVMRQAETYHEYKKAMKERSNSQND